MKLTRIIALATTLTLALASLPLSAQQYTGNPQIQDLLGVLDQIAVMGAAAQRDAQRQAAIAAARAQYEQQQRDAQIRRYLAQLNASANAMPVAQEPSLSQLAFEISVQTGIERNLRIMEEVMGPFRKNYHTAMHGTPEEIAQMMRRLHAQGQQYAGIAAQQQTSNSITQHQARVAAASARSRAIQDADAALAYAQSVLSRRR